MIFFLAAAVWFLVVTVRASEHRVANGYHTFMMLAMAWMYAAMGACPCPGGRSRHRPPPRPGRRCRHARDGHARFVGGTPVPVPRAGSQC